MKLIVIGGFLGAGKTSTIVALGKRLIARGRKVGIITNDQGKNLVDTNFVEREGFQVFEVSQGCFCCNFEQFTSRLRQITEHNAPDVILAEPIGSAVNVVATVMQPVLDTFSKEFTLAPLTVLADPRRVRRLMKNTGASFGTEINYLFETQLQEADNIVLTKADTLSDEERSELTDWLSGHCSWARVTAVSSVDGTGMDDLLASLLGGELGEKWPIEVDYERFAQAEKRLAWLNAAVTLTAPAALDFNGVVSDLIDGARARLADRGAEIAHLKVYAVSGADYAKAGVTSSGEVPGFNHRMAIPAERVNLIINGRVETGPDSLEQAAMEAVGDVCGRYGLTASGETCEAFAPDYPKRRG